MYSIGPPMFVTFASARGRWPGKAFFAVCAMVGLFCVPAFADSIGPLAPLTTVRQIHGMSPEDAARHLPIRLRGVVTTISAYPNAFFMQDATAGISLEGDQLFGVYAGARVEVTGETAPGRFAPLVKVRNVRVLGPGKPPKAPFFIYPELVGGQQDSNWISLRGIVRSATPTVLWGYSLLQLMVDVDGSMVKLQIMDYAGVDPNSLVDAVIRVEGVCTTSFNDKRQFTGVGMITPGMKTVHIEQPAAADAFSLPVTPVRSLLQFKPGVRVGHRVLIQGNVTYQYPGHALYVQDGSDGVMIETGQTTPLPLGTRIAVVGFPAAGVYSPILRQAVFRLIGNGQPIVPALLHASEFFHTGKFVTAPYDAQLVTIQGELIESTSRPEYTTWYLRVGEYHIGAMLAHPSAAHQVPAIEPGSLVSVTGIFVVNVDEAGQPSILRILPRSATDIAVVKKASWWSTRHVMPVLLTALSIVLAMALWGATLRRTVRQQTQMLRESEERFRNQAHHDALTGLVSRSFLHEQLNEAVRRAKISGEKLGLLMVDLDFFKQVNDTLGHHAGDELLRLVAARLRAAVRKTDTVARMGGDEFVVLLTDLSGLEAAAEIGAKVVASVSAPAEIDGNLMPVSASVGVCLYPDGGLDSDTLLQNVDAAMYKAKAEGRNGCAVYTADPKERKPGARRPSIQRAPKPSAPRPTPYNRYRRPAGVTYLRQISAHLLDRESLLELEAGHRLQIVEGRRAIAEIVPHVISAALRTEADRLAALDRLSKLMDEGYDMGLVWNGRDELYDRDE